VNQAAMRDFARLVQNHELENLFNHKGHKENAKEGEAIQEISLAYLCVLRPLW
jgi:hypothetical protein